MPKARCDLRKLDGNLVIGGRLLVDPHYSAMSFFSTVEMLDNEKFVHLNLHNKMNEGTMGIHH
jgi:hypothetical protein